MLLFEFAVSNPACGMALFAQQGAGRVAVPWSRSTHELIAARSPCYSMPARTGLPLRFGRFETSTSALGRLRRLGGARVLELAA